MANLLGQSVTQVQLNPHQLSLLFAQQATAQAALDRKSGAFKKLVVEVQTSKQDAERYKERSKYLELDVARTDAYLAKVRQQFTEQQRKNAELNAELANSRKREKICARCHGNEDERGGVTKIQGGDQSSSYSKEEPGKAQKASQKTGGDKHESSRPDNEQPSSRPFRPKPAVPFQPKPGVSFEHHELFIHQMMLMKQELTRLAKEKGQDVDKILEAAEYKETIKKLQEDIQDKADENERLLEKIDRLCSKKDQPASQIVQLQFMNEKLEKRLNLSQVMIDTLSKRCEELKDELQKYGPFKKEDGRAVHDSKVFLPIQKEEGKKKSTSEKTGSTRKGQDEADGGVSLDQFEQQKQRLNEKIQHLDTQLKKVTGDNKQLIKNRQEAEKQREIFEQRYNALMETMQDIQKKQQQCSNCRSLELEIAKLKQEVADLKEVDMVVRAQMKLYEEDLRQEQQDSTSQKQKNNFIVEQWTKNCQRMGQQVDLLTDDLHREREENRKLKQQLNALKPQGSRSAMSLAPTFSNQRCAFKGPKSSPWQEGFHDMHDIECDGPGQDVADGKDLSDSMGEFYSTSSGATMPGKTPERSSYHSMQSSFSLSRKPLECPRCKREYPADRLEEFQRHVNKCIDSS
ncbi:centrosomal protein of 55 kDa-like [Patiria miniata]|uniref:Uncharacterized protein n=1 Tax=Patiria miniata TaxID=46514 RepID=A0A914A8P5_PATMI|nr:centrosomal protein of 55 kDa-like [Patiria miniata]